MFLSAHLRSDTSPAESRLQSKAKVRLYAEHGRNNSTANSSTNKRQNDAESGICSQRRNLTGGRIYSSSSNLPWMCQRSPASSRWLRILPMGSWCWYSRWTRVCAPSRTTTIRGLWIHGTVVLDDPRGRENLDLEVWYGKYVKVWKERLDVDVSQ